MAFFDPNKPQAGQGPNIPGVAGPVVPEGDDLDAYLKELGMSQEELDRLTAKQQRLAAAGRPVAKQIGQVGDGNVFFDPAGAISNVLERRRYEKDLKGADAGIADARSKQAEARARVAKALPGLSPEAVERVAGSVSDEATLRQLALVRQRQLEDARAKRSDALRAEDKADRRAETAEERAWRESQTAADREYDRTERAKDRAYKAESAAAAGTRPPPGYTWTPDGHLRAIPGGPGDKLPESQQKQLIGSQNLVNGLKDYRERLKGHSNWDLVDPDKRAQIGTDYTNVMLMAKEAYNLGVLNGPDLQILQSALTDPRSFKGIITTNKGLEEQLDNLQRKMESIGQVSANRRPQDVEPTRREALSDSYDKATKPKTPNKVIKWGDL